MKMYLQTLMIILLVFYLPASYAQLKVEVIPLQHRTLDQIIPVIQPLVGEGGAVTGMNNQLIIKTTPANLAEIRQILASLDTPLRRLLITVRQDIDGSRARSLTSLDGSYSTGEVAVTSDTGHDRTGAAVTVQDEDGNAIRLRHSNTRSSLADSNDFRVQTVEGSPAWIQTGKSVPVANRNAYVTRDGVVVQDTVDYHDVTSGFYVVANLSGNNVTLLIAPNLSRNQPGQGAVFDIQNIETTVHGRLGEWISIGGVDQSTDQSGQGILASTRRRNQETRSVLLKVEEIQ